eukprot:178111_1
MGSTHVTCFIMQCRWYRPFIPKLKVSIIRITFKRLKGVSKNKIRVNKIKMDSIDINALSDKLQSRILGKLTFMDGILTGTIPKPPGMVITTGPTPLDNLLKAVKSDMKCDNDQKESKQDDNINEISSTIYQSEPPSKLPPSLLKKSHIQNLELLNKHDSNPMKFPLSNSQILELNKNGYITIDNFIKDKELIKNVQNEINEMNKNGKMKKAGLRRLRGKTEYDNIEILECIMPEINGIYAMNKCKDLLTIPMQLLNKKYKILSDICYVKNNEFGIVRIEITEKLSLFVECTSCWIIFKYLELMEFPIIYYIAKSVSDSDKLCKLKWKCIGGVLPFGKILKTNKWMSSLIRNDLHCWLHNDDKDIGKSLKKCIISMDYIRVELNKLIEFNSQTTQVQATLYPGNGAKYITHIDEPPNIIKNKDKKKRKLTCLMYFNLFEEMYDKDKYGGCLRMYLGNNIYKDIEPIGGRVVLFNSQWLPHQVMPAYFNRYAVTLWMY